MLGAVIGLAPLGCSLLLDDGFDGFTEPRSADAGQLDPNPTREGTTGLDSDPIDAALIPRGQRVRLTAPDGREGAAEVVAARRAPRG